MILEAPETDIAWGSVPLAQAKSTVGIRSFTSPAAAVIEASPAVRRPLLLSPPQLVSSSVETGVGRSRSRFGDYSEDPSVEPSNIAPDQDGNCADGAGATWYHSLLLEGPADIKAAISIVPMLANVRDNSSSAADSASSSFSSDGGGGSCHGLVSEAVALIPSDDDDDEWNEVERSRRQKRRQQKQNKSAGTRVGLGGSTPMVDDVSDDPASAIAAPTTSTVAPTVAQADSGDSSSDNPKDGAARKQPRVMLIRITLPRLHLRMPPDVRAGLSGALQANLLAAGLVGNVSENFPLDVASRCVPEERENSCSKKTAAAAAPDTAIDRRRDAFDPPVPDNKCASLRRSVSWGGSSNARSKLDGGARTACECCGVAFEADLVARHRCAWCGETVCRKCLHTLVRWLGVGVAVMGILLGSTGGCERRGLCLP